MRAVLIGYGEIARRQHAPIICSRSPRLDLAAIVDPVLALPLSALRETNNSDGDVTQAVLQVEGKTLPLFATLQEALEGANDNFQIAIIACPPQFSQDYAQIALEAGINVFMEKPPGLDHRRLKHLLDLALSKNITLFTAYHSTVAPETSRAKEWATKNRDRIRSVHITWKESVTKWHPGQVWITENKLGALDMLINPMSMLEEILGTNSIDSMSLNGEISNVVIPGNWNGPISGSVLYESLALRITADFAWDHEEQDVWTISFRSDETKSFMELSDGGAQIAINGEDMTKALTHTNVLRPEYETLYDKFELLLKARDSGVRMTPLRLVNQLLEKSRVTIGEEYSL